MFRYSCLDDLCSALYMRAEDMDSCYNEKERQEIQWQTIWNLNQ